MNDESIPTENTNMTTFKVSKVLRDRVKNIVILKNTSYEDFIQFLVDKYDSGILGDISIPKSIPKNDFGIPRYTESIPTTTPPHIKKAFVDIADKMILMEKNMEMIFTFVKTRCINPTIYQELGKNDITPENMKMIIRDFEKRIEERLNAAAKTGDLDEAPAL